MNSKTQNIHFSLQDCLDLQNASRISPRACIGRLFYQNDHFGIEDYSGQFWPIVFDVEHNLKSGDTIIFHCKFINDICHVRRILFSVHNTLENDKPHKTHNIPLLSLEKIEILNKRNIALERTKDFFKNRGFFYAETPILVRSGGMESYLHTFQTSYRDFQGRSWTFELPTSPEFALKKLIGRGLPKIFQISHVFRNNGEMSALHEPEFLMLEWYRTGSTLDDIMIDTKNLVITLAQILNSKKTIPKNWPTFYVNDLFIEQLDLNLNDLQDVKKFYESAKLLSTSLRETDSWDDIFCKLFMEKIEPFLKTQTACFVTGYPAQMSALAKNDDKNPLFVQRTEAYLFGVEICNGYQELVDAKEFEQRLNKILNQKNGALQRDKDFEHVMKSGLPPCAGNAVGIDRVIALLLELENIQSLFPLPFAYT
jgi:lysyl-tRNA synthetase class 2